MCGIAGIINLSQESAPISNQELLAMVAAIRHRGPNATGYNLLPGGSGVGHVRLSIIDLDPASNQPFVSDDGNLVLVFNGEIFNYLELRTDLAKSGHHFRTQSDTEVLLHAYQEWGKDCVNRFNGMWAFSIFDKRDRSVFCSRDRFGIKPFVYGIYRDRFYFASEGKAILAVQPHFRQPNYNALSLLLRSSISGRNPETCFKGLLRLPPAHNLTIRGDQYTIERYWDYPVDPLDISYDSACEYFQELLTDSIKIRLRSDVPIGLTLSGGLDSSAIACLTRKNTTAKLKTYTASYLNHPQWDESEKATRLANQLGFTPNRVPLVRSEVVDNIRKAIFHLETPHHSIAILPYWNIIKRARQDVTVLLEGQGADELLGGYVSVTSLNALKADIMCFRPLEATRRLRAGLSGQLGFSGRRFAMDLCRSAFPPLHDVYRCWRGDEQVYLKELRGGPSRIPVRKTKSGYDAITENLMQQHKEGLLDLLHYGDAIPMAHGLESRLPFMDYRLVEFCFRLPGNYKLKNGLGKALLRDSSRGIVPDYILNDNRKLGFVSPIAEWIREDRDIVDSVLNSASCRQRGLLDVPRSRRLIDQHVSGKINIFSNIYRWMMTEIWFQEFIDPSV
jgi:asparagine synthase (glutamine-hydrolysing)